MKPTYVATANTRAWLDGYDAVERRGATEACLMVVEGLPGLGKTRTAQWWAAQHLLPFARAKRDWTTAWMMKDLLAELRVVPETSFPKMFKQAVSALANGAALARASGDPFGVVVDEVDHIVGSSRMMETLRDLSDTAEVPFILIGMGKVQSGLTRYLQITSRKATDVRFMPLSLDDSRAIVAARCECAVSDDLVDLLHTTAKGYARELLEGIAAIERQCRRLDRPAAIADMVGQVLMNDRTSGRPIVVRS